MQKIRVAQARLDRRRIEVIGPVDCDGRDPCPGILFVANDLLCGPIGCHVSHSFQKGLEVSTSGPSAVISTASRPKTAPTPSSHTYPVTASTIPGSSSSCAAVAES